MQTALRSDAGEGFFKLLSGSLRRAFELRSNFGVLADLTWAARPTDDTSGSGVNVTLTTMGATEQIRVSPKVKAALEAEKQPDESYNETVERLIEERAARRRELIREGAGLWDGTDAAEHAKRVRDEMNDAVGPDL